MIRPGFLDSESRQDLIELMRDGSVAHRLARRANALVLLDDGMSCEVGREGRCTLDDDTIRTASALSRGWHRGSGELRLRRRGVPADGGATGPADRWITETMPRTTREVGAWIARECGIGYEGR